MAEITREDVRGDSNTPENLFLSTLANSDATNLHHAPSFNIPVDLWPYLNPEIGEDLLDSEQELSSIVEPGWYSDINANTFKNEHIPNFDRVKPIRSSPIDLFPDDGSVSSQYEDFDEGDPQSFAGTSVHNHLQRQRKIKVEQDKLFNKEKSFNRREEKRKLAYWQRREKAYKPKGVSKKKKLTSMNRQESRYRVYRPQYRTKDFAGISHNVRHEPVYQRCIRLREEARLRHGVHTDNPKIAEQSLDRLMKITRKPGSYYDALLDGALTNLLTPDAQTVYLTDSKKGVIQKLTAGSENYFKRPLPSDEQVLNSLEDSISHYLTSNNLTSDTMQNTTLSGVHSTLHNYYARKLKEMIDAGISSWHFSDVFVNEINELANISVCDSDNNQVGHISFTYHTRYNSSLNRMYGIYEIVADGLPKAVFRDILHNLSSLEALDASMESKDEGLYTAPRYNNRSQLPARRNGHHQANLRESGLPKLVQARGKYVSAPSTMKI